MFKAMTGDAPMDAHLCIVVSGDTLPLLIGPTPVLSKPSPPPCFLPLRGTIEANLHGVGIIERNCPPCGCGPIDGGPLRHRVRVRWKLVDVRGHEIGDAHPDPIPLPSRIDVHHPR
jgi:hypothetical protein